MQKHIKHTLKLISVHVKKNLNKPVEPWEKDCLSLEYTQAFSAFPIVEMLEAKKLSGTTRSLIGNILALSLRSGSFMKQQGTLGRLIGFDKRTVSRIIKDLKDDWYNNGYKEGMDYETRYFGVISGRNKVRANVHAANLPYFMDPILHEVRDYFLESVSINLLKSILTSCRTYYKKVILRIIDIYNTHLNSLTKTVNKTPCLPPTTFLPNKKEKVVSLHDQTLYNAHQESVLPQGDHKKVVLSDGRIDVVAHISKLQEKKPLLVDILDQIKQFFVKRGKNVDELR